MFSSKTVRYKIKSNRKIKVKIKVKINNIFLKK